LPFRIYAYNGYAYGLRKIIVYPPQSKVRLLI